MIVHVSILTLLTAAVWMDLQSAKISNRLILFGLLLGLPCQITGSGARGILTFFFNTFLPVILFYLVYRIKALGAGDIKLLSMLGAFLGTKQFCGVMLLSFAAAAAIGIAKLIKNKILFQRLRALCAYAGNVLLTGTALPYESDRKGWDNRIHFSIPVLLGYILYFGRSCIE